MKQNNIINVCIFAQLVFPSFQPDVPLQKVMMHNTKFSHLDPHKSKEKRIKSLFIMTVK